VRSQPVCKNEPVIDLVTVEKNMENLEQFAYVAGSISISAEESIVHVIVITGDTPGLSNLSVLEIRWTKSGISEN
jgi:hypothetical protein